MGHDLRMPKPQVSPLTRAKGEREGLHRPTLSRDRSHGVAVRWNTTARWHKKLREIDKIDHGIIGSGHTASAREATPRKELKKRKEKKDRERERES